MRTLSLAAAACLLSTSALAAPADDFKALLDEHRTWYLSNNPLQATSLGVRTYDKELGDPSLTEADRQAAEAQAFIDRLDKIPVAQLSEADKLNHAILRRDLAL